MGIHLPVDVKGRDAEGAPWEEMTSTQDVSSRGASFRLEHLLTGGQVLHLALPLPKRFRGYDLTDPSYHVYALARNVGPEPAPVRVGVLFLGEKPPKGFGENPGGRYLLPSDPSPDGGPRRQFPRYKVLVTVRLRRVSPWSGGPQEETTITEDLGRGGAQVLTSLPIEKGELVEVEGADGALRTRAEVLQVRIGKDNVPRLNLGFLEDSAEDAILEILRRAGISGVIEERKA